MSNFSTDCVFILPKNEYSLIKRVCLVEKRQDARLLCFLVWVMFNKSWGKLANFLQEHDVENFQTTVF